MSHFLNPSKIGAKSGQEVSVWGIFKLIPSGHITSIAMQSWQSLKKKQMKLYLKNLERKKYMHNKRDKAVGKNLMESKQFSRPQRV